MVIVGVGMMLSKEEEQLNKSSQSRIEWTIDIHVYACLIHV